MSPRASVWFRPRHSSHGDRESKAAGNSVMLHRLSSLLLFFSSLLFSFLLFSSPTLMNTSISKNVSLEQNHFLNLFLSLCFDAKVQLARTDARLFSSWYPSLARFHRLFGSFLPFLPFLVTFNLMKTKETKIQQMRFAEFYTEINWILPLLLLLIIMF